LRNAKTILTALYWVASLAAVGLAIILLFSADLQPKKAITPKAEAPALPAGPAAPSEENKVIRYESPRNFLPMGESTRLFRRLQFLADGAGEKHTLTYFLYKPAGRFPASAKFPLVLVLHDAEGAAEAAKYLVSTAAQSRHPSIIAVPVLPFGKRWAAPAGLGDVQQAGNYFSGERGEGLQDAVQLLDHLRRRQPVDARRIYVTGCGAGGFGTFGAARRYPDLFAAAAPVNGGWAPSEARRMLRVPLWALHGAQNDAPPPDSSRATARYIKAYGGTAIFTEFPGLDGDCAAPQLYPRRSFTRTRSGSGCSGRKKAKKSPGPRRPRADFLKTRPPSGGAR
jgi:poly(3-hydroxybutyrate) depolymerase